MSRSPIDRIVTQRVVHQLVAQRLIDRVYNQPLIGNVERGTYVECMVELALSESRPSWSLTDTWAAWDLEQEETKARIEVKQSAALQTWTTSAAETKPSPSFDIGPRTGYYVGGSKDGSVWVDTGLMRQADIYIMAWHGETDHLVADHRQPEQWRFFVVPEHLLRPGQKRIGLNPVATIRQVCTYDDLAERVAAEFAELPGLKMELNIS